MEPSPTPPVRPRGPPRPSSATTRELDILGLLGAGRSNIEIARRLGFADKTVPEYGSYVDPRFIESFRAP